MNMLGIGTLEHLRGSGGAIRRNGTNLCSTFLGIGIVGITQTVLEIAGQLQYRAFLRLPRHVCSGL